MAVAQEPSALNTGAETPEATATTNKPGVMGNMANVRENMQKRMGEMRTRFMQEARYRYTLIGIVLAFLAIVGATVYTYATRVEYGVLYSGFSDKDGGSIVAALEQMNVPYKITNGGGAILVPTEAVHGLRLKLASEGLPKASGVGFEVMENQKIGTSQFLEQVNFQRALEGELGRTIQSLEAVQHARVHLAMQKQSVFVRDQQKPTASVLLTLYHGRSLDRRQVTAMIHLVASSVPGLTAANVTIVDQNGELLSWQDKERTENEKLDAKQMEYVKILQKQMVQRVESILTPVVGEGNVRAEATVEVDFSKTEQADEIYKPNQAPNAPSIRSQQSLESQKLVADPYGGIPGGVTNQPPVPPIAPLIQNNPGQQPTAPPGQRVFTPIAGQNGNNAMEGKKESVINYEVDKTVRYSQKAKGDIKRLTVAVVVNYKYGKDENGRMGLIPLTDSEKEQVTALVREAVGYNPERGDSVSVLNTRFAPSEEETRPLWKNPNNMDIAKEVGKYVLIFGIFLWLYMALIRPLIYRLSGREEAERRKREAEESARLMAEEAERRKEMIAQKKAQREAERLAAEQEEEDEKERLAALLSDDDEDDEDEDEDDEEDEYDEEGNLVSEGKKRKKKDKEKEKEPEPYAELLEMAKKMTMENPKAVSLILMEWLGNTNE